MRDPEAALDTSHLRANLGARSARGGALTIAAHAGKVALQVVTVAVLARLLPPAAFGLVAIVAAINAILDLVREFGLSAATIRKPDISHAEVSALFWVNSAMGALLCAALILLAPALAAIYGEPGLIGIMRWLALGFLVSGFGVQHWALLRRQMRFGAMAMIDVGSEVAGLVVALVLATEHAGYWALVAQRVTVPVVALFASWSVCRWRPGLPRRVAGLSTLLTFGASVTGVNVVAAAARSLDQALVGLVWGVGALGIYERAAKLLLAPSAAMIAPLYSVTMPLLSRLEPEHARYRRAFCGMIKVVAIVIMPGAALVAVCADWVVAVVFGGGWSEAAPLVACFAVAAACQPVIQITGLLYLTQGRGRDMVRAALIDAALCVVAVLTGLRFGPLAVATALAAIGWAARLPVAAWLGTSRGPVGLIEMVIALTPAMVASLVVAGLVAAMRVWALPPELGPGLGLPVAAAVAAAGVVATLAIVPQGRQTLFELARILRLLGSANAPPLAHS